MRLMNLPALSVAVVVACIALGGCSSTARDGADEVAHSMLQAAVLPPGAQRTGVGTIDRANQEPACAPLVDESQTWIIENATVDSVLAFLRDNPGPGLHLVGSGTVEGQGRPTGADVTQKPIHTRDPDATLVFSMVSIGNDVVEVRLDAQAVPDDATCIRSETNRP